jgi:anti-sigma B factor antagonist
MSITTSQKGDVSIIALTGSVDSKNAPLIRDELLASLRDAKNVIIDMTGVDYLSSAGLRLLLLAYRDVTAHNGKIVLVGVSEEIQGVMSNTGFIKFFHLVPTESDAMSSFV